MYLHANAKLGLAGRLALVQSIEAGCSIRARGGELQCLAGNRPPLVEALASGERSRAYEPCLSSRSLEPARTQPQTARPLTRAGDL